MLRLLLSCTALAAAIAAGCAYDYGQYDFESEPAASTSAAGSPMTSNNMDGDDVNSVSAVDAGAP